MSPVKDFNFEFENLAVELVATRSIPRIETAGSVIEATEAGRNFTTNLWIALELVEEGLARFTVEGVDSDEWTQIHYRERFQPLSRPFPLPDGFYHRAHYTFSRLMKEAKGDTTRLEHLNRLRGMYRDILESRISKIVRLASAEAAILPSSLQPEESLLYSELHALIASWREEMRKLEAR